MSNVRARRLQTCIAIAGVLLIAWPPAAIATERTAAASISFQCVGPTIKVSPPADAYSRWEPGVHLPGTVFDARGTTFHLRHSSNPNPEGVCRYSGAGQLSTNSYPIVNPGGGSTGPLLGTADACFQGGRVLGEVSLVADMYVWSSQPKGYCNSAAMDLKSNVSTHQIVEGTRIDRVWDGIRFNGRNCRQTPGLCHNVIRHVWISNARDDCIENDGLGGLAVEDSLLDGCFAGISSDPGGCAKCPPPHRKTDVIHLSGVLLRMQGFPYTYEGARQMHHVGAFKIHEKYGPALVIENSVIAFEFYIPDRHNLWNVGWKRIKSCSNNYLLWLSDEPFPSGQRFPLPPGCFKILKGQDARAFWRERRAAWIRRHGDVMRTKDDAF